MVSIVAIITIFFALLGLSPLAVAQEEVEGLLTETLEEISSYEIPKEEILQMRLIESEIRAIRAETTLELQEKQTQREALLKIWKERYKIADDFKGWSLDLQTGKLQKIKEKQKEKTK